MTNPQPVSVGDAAHVALEAGAVQRPAEFARLLELAEGRRELTGRTDQRVRVLEIGSYEGGTLAGFRAWWPAAEIVAVDLPAFPDREPRSWGAHMVLGDSHDESTLERVLWATPAEPAPRGFDLLFIDGDHELEGVRRDVEMYGPLVRDGGLLALHDVTPFNEGRSPAMGPDLLWRELKLGRVPGWRAYAEIIDYAPDAEGRGPWWGGIGLAVRP